MDDALAADARAAPGREALDEEQDGEDEVADWTQFARLLQSVLWGLSLKSNKRGLKGEELPFIPRRGDKEFAPVEDVDFRAKGHAKALETSRNAFYSALEAGQARKHSSKQHNRAIWHSDLKRASMGVESMHGIHFTTMGHYVHARLRVELLPEEALYLVERGTLECWTEESVPMSAQQAFSAMLDVDDVTMAKYQVYAYLKRLGFSVHRAPLVQSRNKITVNSTNSFNPLKRCLEKAKNAILNLLAALRIIDRPIAYCRFGAYRRRPPVKCEAPLLQQERWRSYNRAFHALQIIPAGHAISEERLSTETFTQDAPDTYQTFWNVYKPSTKYKKSAPPDPDFAITVIDITNSPFPDLLRLQQLFQSLPDPVESPLSTPANSMNKVARPIHRNSNFKGKPLPYAKLKNSGSAAVIAAIDSGTLYFMKLNQAEFAMHHWLV